MNEFNSSRFLRVLALIALLAINDVLLLSRPTRAEGEGVGGVSFPLTVQSGLGSSTTSGGTVHIKGPSDTGLTIKSQSGDAMYRSSRDAYLWADRNVSMATGGTGGESANVFTQTTFNVTNLNNTASAGIYASGMDSTAFGGSDLTLNAGSNAINTTGSQIKFIAGTTGGGSALLGANCPAVTASAPSTWLKVRGSDGSQLYVPAWK